MNAVRRTWAAAPPGSPALGLIAAIAAAPALLIGGPHGGELWALTVIAFVGLMVDIPLPGGGEMPLGSAILVSAIVLLPARQGLLVSLTAVLMLLASASPWPVFRLGWLALTTPSTAELPRGIRAAAVATRTAPAAAIACAVQLALSYGAPSFVRGRGDLLVFGVVAIGTAYYLVDGLLVRRRQVVRRAGDRVVVQLALLCASALIVVGYRVEGVGASLIAGIPLIVTRFSFRRHAAARNTYEQTVAALGTLPEVAGFATLGHAERSAAYAALLADALGLDAPTAAQVAVAARLHHLGEVSLPHPESGENAPTPAEIGAISAKMLQDTGFLADVAPLVEEIVTAGAPVVGLPAAIVRVASTMDDVAASHPELWGPTVPTSVMTRLIDTHPTGPEARVAAAMVSLCVGRSGEVAEIAARRLASGLHLHDAGTGIHSHVAPA